MATLKFRDRDAVITKEGLIFRVLGNTHPKGAYTCDVEYAPATIFKSNNPKAFRSDGKNVFYKFFEDEGWKFLKNNYPHYLIFNEMLQKDVVGVDLHDIASVRKPDEELTRLVENERGDELLAALKEVLELSIQHSGLQLKDFGVFGSMLHGFHNPKYSDIDLIVYGRKEATKLRDILKELYASSSSPLRNEFETDQAIAGKPWRFRNLSPEEYVSHQRRKTIYALFTHEKSGKIIKTEFEPVKKWNEIANEYNLNTRILQHGWVKMLARITNDADALFIPSIYNIEPLGILDGKKEAVEARRIVSYMEEFRMQACKDVTVYVEGNLEEVVGPKSGFFQITLTYCPRYFEQVLKVAPAYSVSHNYPNAKRIHC